jgi:hypothetical protein
MPKAQQKKSVKEENVVEPVQEEVAFETPVTPEPDAPTVGAEAEIDEITTLHERTIAALSYIGFLAIVPFYLKKDSKFCRFHGKQGLLLAILFYFCKLFMVLNFLNDLILVLQFAIFVYMGFATLAGRWKKVPWVYKWACQLEEQLTLKTKEEEENEAKMKPDEVIEEVK